jgi:D-beta-D-heptose 7-phosphate kinase/D-beta-D-heptose 1-phosphate adenosyltransferase
VKKVLVIGDSCQDIFKYGTCDRISPEAPVAVMKPTRSTCNGGMAKNVFENLKALGIDCYIITNDIRPVKTRYVDEVSNQMLLRVDENDSVKQIDLELLKKIDFYKYDIVIISDYNKGFLSTIDIEAITELHPLVFMDSKKKIDYWARGVEYIKINQKEFDENIEFFVRSFKDRSTFSSNLIVTNGKSGAILDFTQEFPIEIKHDVRDLSGAGDTFLAGLVADYIKNNDIRRAISFANRCAAWVVSQKGVAVVNPEMI